MEATREAAFHPYLQIFLKSPDILPDGVNGVAPAASSCSGLVAPAATASASSSFLGQEAPTKKNKLVPWSRGLEAWKREQT